MITDCHECGGKVSTEAKTCPHCGAPVVVTPAPPEPSTTKRKSRLLDRLVLIVVAFALVGVVLWFFLPPSGREGASRAVQNVLRLEQTLLEETLEVGAGEYQGYRLNLPKEASVTIRVAVREGSAIDVYLMNEQDKEELDKASQKFFGGQFRYRQVLSRQSTKTYTDSAVLPRGVWYVIIRSTDVKPLLGKGGVSSVYLKVVARG